MPVPLPPSDAPPTGEQCDSAAPEATPLGADRRRVLLLVNRKAGAGRGARKVAEAETLLRESGLDPCRLQTPDELTEAAAEAMAQQTLRAVVAIGGDGTVGLALNRTPAGTALAVMPAGTENLLAKYLEQRARPRELVDLLTGGVEVRLDAGEANGRLFALMISVGFDADVVHRVHRSRRGNITHLAYAKPFFDALRIYKYPSLRAAWQGPGADAAGGATGRWLFGMNLPRYAQGLPISPEASGTDGLIDLCVFKRGYASSAVWYLWNLLRRRHHRLPSVSITPCREFSVESDEKVPYQLDGDPGGFLPVTVRSMPQRLTCIVRPDIAARLGFRLPS
ncbi:putative lipid kinase [Posidoniimonas corsicana]|uniref:Putative lipid kinase n=1 Tax=Posidoniimonas corsicana TaxID=1938618 RepID=A0A5C5VDX7_9BACT|nr:diacylglycerol kinase family protein [Posidoniimonas corsicana]TWT36119.1 putative lipid kinase [Posidoniimonas corsicana]